MDLTLIGDSSLAVGCKLDAVTEVDSDGTALASAGFSHSIAISTATSLTFGTISASSRTDVSANAVVAVTAPSILPGTNAQVETNFAVFQASGTIAPEGSTGLQASVVNGTGELTVTVSAWPWCSTAGVGSALCLVGGESRAGAFLDMEFTFGTTDVAKLVAESSSTVEFGVGAGASVILSKHATVNGQLVAVASGFPVVMATTSTSLRIKVRVPRPSASATGSGSIRYDPILKASGGGSSEARVFEGNNVQISVDGAGTVDMRPISSAGVTAQGEISMRIGSIAEVDSSGNAVSSLSGTVKAFQISAAATGTFGLGPVRGETSLGVQASSVDISGTLWSTATISQQFIVFAATGTVNPEGSGGFSTTVNNGTVKASIEISNWPYCGSGGSPIRSCQAEGAYLDVQYNIKTRASATVSSDSALARTFDIGGGARLVFSKRVIVEGQWRVMPPDFPKLQATATTSTSATVVVRIPKPANPAARVLYDPAMDNGDGSATSASINGLSIASLASALVAALVATLR